MATIFFGHLSLGLEAPNKITEIDIGFKQVREAGVVVEVSPLSSKWAVKVKAEVCAWRVSALAAA